MNKVEFGLEIHDYMEFCLKEFSGYQDAVKDTLLEFHRLCEENNLIYTLAFGTLLGAIRDNGQIPWDYDVDVIMPANQKEKLIACLEDNLSEEYYYAYNNNMETYPTSCLRICKKGYAFTVIHVDVFFLAACPDDEIERRKFVNKMNTASYLRSAKFSQFWFQRKNSNGMKGRIMKIYDWAKSKCILPWMYDAERKLMSKYSLGDTKYCCVVGDLDYKKVYEYNMFAHRILVRVGNHYLYVPKEYDKVLKFLYDDYMKYPSIEQRFDDFYNMLRITRERNRKYCEID